MQNADFLCRNYFLCNAHGCGYFVISVYLVVTGTFSQYLYKITCTTFSGPKVDTRYSLGVFGGVCGAGGGEGL